MSKYRIAGMFGSEKVWWNWRIISLIHQTIILFIINFLMAESIYLPNFILPTTYDFGNLSNINLTKYSHYTIAVRDPTFIELIKVCGTVVKCLKSWANILTLSSNLSS